MNEITQVILNLRDEYIDNKFVENYREINCGLCSSFAEEVDSIVKECDIISNDYLVRDIDSGWNGNGEDDWDINSLLKYNSPPPNSMPMEELKTTVQGYHCWIHYQEKHYDSECPSGVNNLFELPFFKRCLEQNSLA